MNGHRMKSRTSWAWLGGAAALIAGPFVSCSGPIPIGSNATGGNGASNPGGGSSIHLIPGGGGATGASSGTDISDVDGGNCGVTTGNLTKTPGDLLLILDRSGSMAQAMDADNNCATGATNCQQRWATMISGLNTVFASPAGTAVNWGLELFSSNGQCNVNTTMDINVSSGGAAAILQRLPQVTPNGYTPTRAGVNAGVAYLKTLTGPEPKSILLATDGEPNCNGSNDTTDVPGTVTAITAAATAGFKVYVLGVGPDTGNLDNFASAGQTDHYYPALSPQDLNTALAAIVGAVASCTFALGKAPPVPSNVAVQFNDDKSLRAPQDTTHTNGWDYTNATTIQLYGSWCDNVTNGTYKSAKILMGCPGQKIP